MELSDEEVKKIRDFIPEPQKGGMEPSGSAEKKRTITPEQQQQMKEARQKKKNGY